MRSLRVTTALACVALAACAAVDEDMAESEGAVVSASVDTVVAAPLPIREVSGLGQRKSPEGIQYLAIGDSSHDLVTFDVAANGRVSRVRTHDLSRLFGRGASQWEGVTGDGEGRVFFLDEADSTIAVVTPGLDRVLHTITLSVPRDFPLASAWRADANSRAEGLVLLANGHVIVAKEKSPPALVELGPPGSVAEGYRPDLALGARAFPLPSGSQSELVALKHWSVKTRDGELLSDLSDLALDEQNRLLLLSDQGRAIARIERQLDPTEAKIDVKAIFRLPSSVQKPEGLTFAAGRPFVATDGRDVERDSLYEIEALP